MKTKKVLMILIFMLMLIAIPKKSLAGIQIVPLTNGISAYYSISASDAFTACYEMRNNELKGYNVDPHMATSLDWGAVAYLAQSRYGANSSSVSANTTGNATGVYNMNLEYFTATMAEERTTTNSNRDSLEAALADDNMKKYVDLIPIDATTENTKGRAMKETNQWYGAMALYGTAKDYPLALRYKSAFGVYFGSDPYNRIGSGAPGASFTFRPVIWN